MTLAKRNYQNQLPYFFDSFLLKDLFDMSGQPKKASFAGRNAFPAVNIKEAESHFELEVAAPGWKKEDFNLQLEKDVLTISSKVQEEKEEEKYRLKEFSLRSFSRSFSLPESKIETEKIEAAYQEGVLRVRLPKKKEEVEKTRKIEIV